MARKMPQGYIVYDGPSAFDGSPILAIVTGFKTPSTNVKTGPMLQLRIINKFIKPSDAVKSGDNVAICGKCPLRKRVNPKTGKQEGVCYVNQGQGENAAYKAYLNGNYPVLTDFSVFNGFMVRFGTYGDPSMLPYELCEKIADNSLGWTGYSHQWAWCDQRFAGLLMASVESERGKIIANAKGWKTFRVKRENDSLLKNEVHCLADRPKSLKQCISCGLCSGNKRTNDVAVNVHGATKKQFKAA